LSAHGCFYRQDEWDFSKFDPLKALGQGKSVAIVNVLTGIQSLEGSAVGFGWWGAVDLAEVLILTAGLPVESITTNPSKYNRQCVAPWVLGGEKMGALGSGFPWDVSELWTLPSRLGLSDPAAASPAWVWPERFLTVFASVAVLEQLQTQRTTNKKEQKHAYRAPWPQ
jgi:hypothetical protein